MDVEKLFNDLESNNLQQYEETKKKLTEFFSQTKEQWLVQGMLDYYLTTNSIRIIEILVKVQSPHDIYIFDRLSDWLRGQNRVPSLTVFSFIVRKHPTWLYKVAKHRLMKDILKLLQNEKEIIPLMSALLSIITLLPIIPSLVPNFLPDLFDVFGHLASWNCQNPNRLNENQLIHLQIGLYMLFHRLYGMYPCHFISYLREFKDKEKGAIFHHTIKPLLETVRMHPLLVTATKDSELNSVRWKEMEPHDVVVECAKLSLDYYQDNSECFASAALRSQESVSGGNNETPASKQLQASLRDSQFQGASTASSFYSSLQRQELGGGSGGGDIHHSEIIWSPSIDILGTPPPTGTAVPHTPTPSSFVGVPLAGTAAAVVGGVSNSSNLLGPTGASPPEAAVEATPETTPMKDISVKRVIASNSPVIRAILPTSQPSSPMRKDQSPFNFPESSINLFTSTAAYSIEQTTTTTTTTKITSSQRLNQTQPFLVEEQQPQKPTFVSTKYGTSSFAHAHPPSLDSPTNFTESTTQDDPETTTGGGSGIGDRGPRHSDTLQDISNECGEDYDVDDDDETERSPCSVGGLHVPTNHSMQIFAQRIRRNRLASCCYNDTSSYLSYGTSPADHITNADITFDDGNNSSSSTAVLIKNAKIRRVKSWHGTERYNCLLSLCDDKSNYYCNMETVDNQQKQQEISQPQQNGDSSSPSGDDAISAATHFKKLQQKKERKLLCNQKHQQSLCNNSIRNHHNHPFYPHLHYSNNHRMNNSKNRNINRNTTETQTIQQWPPQVYEFNLFELFSEDNRLRLKFSSPSSLSSSTVAAVVPEMTTVATTSSTTTVGTTTLFQQPSFSTSEIILEQYIEKTMKMRQHSTTIDTLRNREEQLKDQIQLLQLQVQFERYRREIHAERNRRLLGKNRELRSLQMDNDRLKNQLSTLQNELNKLIQQCDASRHLYQMKENEMQQEIKQIKLKYNTECEDNKKLRLTIEQLQRRLNDEIKQKHELNYEIEQLQGEIFDLRNDMQQAQHHAELGTQYRLELQKLESEFLMMGENQIKCRDKLNELDNYKAKEDELSHAHEVCKDELKELKRISDTKSEQLDAVKHKLSEIQSQLSNKEIMFTEQKRLLKSVKEEYEEKFKALSNKYEVQKAIILSMEQTIFELYKNQSAVNLSTFSPDTDKTDIAGSVDHTSPLSISLASSEGLSASLRSLTELRNLQALVVQPKATVMNTASRNTVPTQIAAASTSNKTSTSLSQCQQQSSRRGSSNIFSSQQQQQQISSSSSSLARYTRTSSVPNASHTASSSSSSSVVAAIQRNIGSGTIASPLLPSGTRHSASSPDIPVPGPNQHHSNLRHHR